ELVENSRSRWSRPRHRDGAATSCSELDLLRDAERVVNLDPEVSNGAFQLRMSEQKLNCPQVTRLLIDLGRLRPPHRVRATGGAVKPALSTQAWTIRVYCRVERCGCVRKRLGKTYCPFLASTSGSQARIEARVCSVISNWTGRPV